MNAGLAVLSGILFALAFPPISWSWLAWVALVPFGWALEREAAARGARRAARAGFGLGYALGLALFLVALHWIALLKPIAVTVRWIIFPAWPAAAAYLALYPALAGALVLALRARRGWPVALTLPVAWVAAEKLRGLGELGFPWLWLGYSQWDRREILQWASLGGPLLVSLLLAVGNALILRATLGGAAAGAASRRRWAAAALVFLAGAWWGGARLVPRPLEGAPGRTRVALVQGNVPGEVKWDPERNREVLELFLALSGRALAEGPELILWPETATGSYLARDPLARSALQSFVDANGVPILTGFPDYRWDRPDRPTVTNSAGTFEPLTGLRLRYDKMHLVPFGERLPFQWLWPGLGGLDLGQAEFTPGDTLVLLPAAGERAAALICFESIFPEIPRRARREGATLLVNLTNDEWFGDSGALYQHAAMSVFRAVETRLPLARCANTGLSFLVDPSGRVRERTGAFTRETRVADLAAAGEPPLFVRLGDWVGAAALSLAVLGLLAARRRSL